MQNLLTRRTSPHLALAHSLVSEIICQGDSVLDATCGNGWDTLFLARKVLTKDSGLVYGVDIQQIALDKTYNNLKKEFSELELSRIRLFHQSHESFPSIIPKESLSAIMYNLGYLPGGDKNVITRPNSSLLSIKSGQNLLRPGGIMTILCYRGHNGGKDETNAIQEELTKLDPVNWQVKTHELLESSDSPLLLTINRKL